MVRPALKPSDNLLTSSRFLRGANASTTSNPNPENKRRKLILLSCLIDYPGLGLILYETGCAEDVDVVSEVLHSGNCIALQFNRNGALLLRMSSLALNTPKKTSFPPQ